jgi:hypothetical protein
MGFRSFLATVVVSALLAACSGGFPSVEPDASTTTESDAGGPPPQGPSMLPFAVDDWFAPSGYMGDGATPGAIMDLPTCVSPRPAGWVGNCHKFTWTPATVGWGGVYWQFPDGNWGDKQGLLVPAGATKISFQAWGKQGGEKVSFMAGMKAVDGFELKKENVVLTNMPSEYSIDLTGTSYVRVVGGFGWTAAESTVPVTFNVDDIRWE